MKLKELYEISKSLMEQGKAEDEVLITLSESSVGARASAPINSVYAGFDWEHGQVRVEPKDSLISKLKDRDKQLDARIIEYNNLGRKHIIRKCPICENHLKKDDKYCSRCGQAIKHIK